MEDRNYIHHEGDALDRELNALVREITLVQDNSHCEVAKRKALL
jgi:hypothetical protein